MEMKSKMVSENAQSGKLRPAGWLILLAAWLTTSLAAAADPPKAGDFLPLDLGPVRTKVVSNAPISKSWSALPVGLQTFDGVPFQIGGPIELTGIDDASNGEFHPPRLPAITLGRKAARLHLLHGTVRGDKDGVPIARVVFHYANGEQRSARLAYGVHARNWVQDSDELRSEMLDPDTRVAWTTATEDLDQPQASLRLFHTALANPSPELEIRHLEIISMFSRATPFICALTVEGGSGAAPDQPATLRRVVKKSLELEDSAYYSEFLFRAVDASTGQPVPGAHAVLTIRNDETAFYFGDARADAGGTIHLPFPPQQAVAFTALVRAPGRVPFTLSGTKMNGGDFPREIRAELKAGTKIAGTVIAKGGRPVRDAAVVIYKLTQDSPREYTRIDYESVRTDQDGRWSSATVPADFEGFSFQISHPENRTTTYLQGNTAGSARTITREELLAGRANLELAPATRIEGLVTDSSSRKPIASAELHLVNAARNEITRTTKSDANGQFSFIVPDAGELGLMIQAAGYRTKFQPLPAQDELVSLTLGINKASPLNGRVIDQSQQPVAGARVRLDTWNGTRLLDWQTMTDEQGRFSWDNPADGTLMLRISATNHTSTRMSFSNPGSSTVIRLRRLSQIVGRVTDADTGKPIDDFTITRGRNYNYDEPMRWDRYDSARGRRGHYVLRLNEYSSGSGGGSQSRVEAPGDLPAASEVYSEAGS
jgi:uncharacterized GH25 family protein